MDIDAAQYVLVILGMVVAILTTARLLAFIVDGFCTFFDKPPFRPRRIDEQPGYQRVMSEISRRWPDRLLLVRLDHDPISGLWGIGTVYDQFTGEQIYPFGPKTTYEIINWQKEGF